MVERPSDRRRFLQLAAGAATAAAADPIGRALALPARRVTGTLDDLEHVVIFMQENRAFDHYFGTLRGVRGYADPRPLTLPSGASVFHQPRAPGSAEVVTPFHLDSDTTRAQAMFSLDHSWKGSHDRWKWHDAWVPAKQAYTMGHFTRQDIPFYHALADAFTICDGYHCSMFGPTNPNRMYLFTGTSGLAAGYDGKHVAVNPEDEDPNVTADAAADAEAFRGFGWTTYAERLQAAGVSWRVYQEFDNYGDNPLAFFTGFRGLDTSSPLYQRGRAWVDGSNAANAKTSNGDHLVAAFAKDVADDSLPQVSWIVAPYPLCEHPSATPAAGENLTARLIAALTANPKVWAKTALILNYDENDGFFDHVPPPIPPTAGAAGKSTVDMVGESFQGVPVGLGPRVPLIVVSPWTKGGFVNSQTFDHTSVIRLLEARFGVANPLITPWRRAVTGDLTSVFDFRSPDHARAVLPDASGLLARARAQASLPWPKPPATPGPLPRQEPGRRPARALPYAFEATAKAADEGLVLDIANTGSAGAAFNLYPAGGEAGPWYYAVEAGKSVRDTLPIGPDGYELTLFGPNGFLRGYRGHAGAGVEVEARYDAARESLLIAVRNDGSTPVTLGAADAYAKGEPHTHRLAPGEHLEQAWPIAASAHWYDISLTLAEDDHFLRRLAGHIETGRPSLSDPALG